ncbi:MAG TPA: hypothetical protein PKY12_00935 [Catalimonadaceae bacterium]|nr:hypothetical protein [Catalimonadaceae bacterium]
MIKTFIFKRFGLLFGIFSLVGLPAAFSQEGELSEEQILIQKDKKIVLPEVAKPQEKVLVTLKPLPKVKQKYSYREFPLALPLLDPKLKAPIPKTDKMSEIRQGFVRIGVGNYGSTLLDAIYNSGRQRDYAFGAYINHQASASGPVDNSGYSRNEAGAYGKYFTPNFTLSGGLDYSRRRYNFYGYDQERFKDRKSDSTRQVFQSILFNLDLEKNKKGKPLQYGLGLSVGNISDRFQASESEIIIRFSGNYRLKDSSSFRLFSDISLAKRADSSSQNRSLWRIQPQYHFAWKGFMVEAGFQASVDNEPELKDAVYKDKTRFHFHPQLLLQQAVFQQKLLAFAGIGGGMVKRNLRSFLEVNPYLAPNVYLRHENQLLNFFVGVKGQFQGQWQYRSQLSFETLANQAFYLNDTTNREKFQLVYDDNNTRRFTFETEVTYDVTESSRAGVRAAFMSYGVKSLSEPWHAPHSLITLFGRQSISDNFLLSGEFYYMGGLKSLNPESLETETLTGMADLNLKGEYFFKKRFSGYVSAHNILNNKNQRFLYYPTQGFRLMVGATASF